LDRHLLDFLALKSGLSVWYVLSSRFAKPQALIFGLCHFELVFVHFVHFIARKMKVYTI